MTETNEAAERLRNQFDADGWAAILHDFDEALAAERRATVERIRAAVVVDRNLLDADQMDVMTAILDEEAAR